MTRSRGAALVLVARSAWDTITAELDRVAPREGVLLPLVALERLGGDAPCAPMRLADIETVVLAEAIRVPAHLQANSLAHVSALRGADALVDAQVRALVRRSPRLRTAAFLHSHPFAARSTWPSHGDITGHLEPQLAHNQTCGLEASFSFIACGRWHLPCFAMDAHRRVIPLGDAEVVPDTDPHVVRARASRPRRFWLRDWLAQWIDRGFTPRVDELFDGWLRARIELAARRVLVVLFPLAFPALPARYHVVHR